MQAYLLINETIIISGEGKVIPLEGLSINIHFDSHIHSNNLNNTGYDFSNVLESIIVLSLNARDIFHLLQDLLLEKLGVAPDLYYTAVVLCQ